MAPLTDEEIARHNAAYRRGWERAEPYILLDGAPRTAKLGRRDRRRLDEAAASLHEALDIAPDNWPTHWALGKIYQRLGRPEEALGSFRTAYRLDPSHADVAREAGVCALSLGDGTEAVRWCSAALAAAPGDPGLTANLALAHLISGETARAETVAREAVARDPHDAVSRRVLALVEDVREGRRPAPHRI